ncbi:uncharacterized protein BDV17DRAFT_30841 [Aspergillus undulatus]|uniref:uncharacterized protein n=1 Tax=Aspergillus undulatus TaxID=1810928 RepID=UPI003CCDDC09
MQNLQTLLYWGQSFNGHTYKSQISSLTATILVNSGHPFLPPATNTVFLFFSSALFSSLSFCFSSTFLFCAFSPSSGSSSIVASKVHLPLYRRLGLLLLCASFSFFSSSSSSSVFFHSTRFLLLALVASIC